MIKSTIRTGMLCLLVATLAAAPASMVAQESAASAAKSEAKQGKTKPAQTPFNGKLKSVDKTARTITIGERTIQITEDTKIVKNGKPATLDDAIVGEPVGGAYRKTDAGALNATSIRFGAKETAEAAAGSKEKKAKKSAMEE